jgi:Uma2 family endonuclease
MSSVTTNPKSIPSPSPRNGPALTVPSLDELERMTSIPDERVVIRDVDWAFYEQLVDSIPEGANLRVDFDGKDLEIITKGVNHEAARGLLGKLVSLLAYEFGLPFKSLGETTWKRPEIARGLEADECFYFRPEKLVAMAAAKSRKSQTIADYPNPDLAIEIDLSPSRIERPGIYAALGVAEIWRFDGEYIIIERLSEGGRYATVETSAFVPIRAEEVSRWLVEEDSSDESAWARRLLAWIRAELATRVTR